jgi:hypothetical protein
MKNKWNPIISLVLVFSSLACQMKSKILTSANPPSAGQQVGISTVQTAAVMAPAPMSANALVNSWIKLAGISNSTNVIATYNAQASQLPQAGNTSEINSASMASVLILASSVCRTLADQEKLLAVSNRKAFTAINFTPAATVITVEGLLSTAAAGQTAQNLTKMFLGRDASSDEKTSAVAARDSALAAPQTITATNNKQLAEDVAVSLCTGILGSVESLSL